MTSPVRIMPLGDSLTEFDCRLNAYTTADDKPIFQPLDTVPAVAPFGTGTFFVVAPGGYRGYLAELLGDPKRLPLGAANPSWCYVGRNFGCGSSREHAPIAILGAGVRAVIADSFPRIFFRNAINVGLPVLESPEAAAALQAGAEIKVDLATGRIVDVATGRTFQAAPLPEICAEITAAGGLMGWVRQRLEGRAGVAGGAR